MPVIDPVVGAADVWDADILEPGRYELRLADLKEGTSKKGEPQYLARFEVEGVEGEYEAIFERITFPGKDRNAKARNFMLLQWRSFLSLFGKSPDEPIDTDDLVGEIIEVEVGHDTYEGKTKNVLVLPKIRKEAA